MDSVSEIAPDPGPALGPIFAQRDVAGGAPLRRRCDPFGEVEGRPVRPIAVVG